MKQIHIRRPDIKGFFTKVKNLKNLKPEDIKRHHREKKERRQRILEERRNSRFAKKMQPVYKWMNRLSLPLQFLLACVINFLIETVSRLSFFEAWEYMTGTPLVFLYNAFMIFVTFMIVYLFRRRVFARILLSVFWVFLGTCNGYLLTKRVTPFNAQDLKVLSDALELTGNYFNAFELVMIIIGVAALVLWIVSMWRRGGQFTGKMHRIIALGGVAVSFGTCLWLTDEAIDKRVISNYFGNIAFAYEDYGFPYCFSASLFNTGINEPAGYSEETMDKISDGGEITKASTGRSDEELPNVMFVQLESFFDPTEVEWLRFSEDPIPNLRKLFNEYSSGYFKVPSVGAGTANTEYEVLTGMSMRFFGPGEYPYKTYAKFNPMESAASALKNLGYGAEALHNNGGNFYSRAEVFNNMGFDHYTSKEFMNILQTTPKGWATDDILVPNIMESMDTTEGQDFVFTVSVEGHGEYQMDKFAGELIEAVQSRNEPTVLVFYGDHLPTMDLEAKDLKSRYLYNTNYVIWDNIGLEKKDMNLAAYQIMAEVFDRLDIHSGTVFNYHQQRRETKDYLADLELLQYDMMYGDQYIYDKYGAPVIEPHMVMGVKDAQISQFVVQADGTTYTVYGDNFTKQSKVYINGEKQTTTFLNNTRLDLKDSQVQNGDVIMVAQVGSSNTIFRESKSYEYNDGVLTEIPRNPAAPENGRQAFVEQEDEEEGQEEEQEEE